MTIPLTVNNVTFDYPEKGDVGWADDATGWANAITNSLQVNSTPLTTKGDLYTYTTQPARLAVGPNGTVLVADSSQATGLHWLSVPGVSGSVTGFTFNNANGFTGVVTTPTSTPTLTLSMATLPISGGGTGQTTPAASFNALAPTTSAGDTIYHNGLGNVRLPGNPTGKQYVLSNSGTGAITWSLPTYLRQAVINTPCDMNALPTNDLSVDGNGNWLIQGLIGNVANRPPGSSLPLAGQTIGMSGGAAQYVYSTGGTIQWTRRKVGGFWSNWQEAIIPDQTGQAGKFLFSNGTNTSWQIGGGGGGGSGSISSLSVNAIDGIQSTVSNPTGPNTVIDLSLTTTGVFPGAYTNASVVIDQFGRITAAASGTIGIGTVTNVSIIDTADTTGVVLDSTTTPKIQMDLTTTGVTPGTYGYSNITVDSKGRITSASTGILNSEQKFTTMAFNGTPVTIPLTSDDVIYVSGVTANTTITLPQAQMVNTVRTMTWFCPTSSFNLSFTRPGGGIRWENGLSPTLSNTTQTIIVLSFVPPTNSWYGVISYGYV